MGTTQVDVLGGTPENIQVDVATGLVADAAIKAPCFIITTGNITLSGEQTIDGQAVTAGKRVLVNAQTDGTTNGLYTCAAGEWTRCADANSSDDFVEGTQVRVTSGTNAGLYELNTSDPIVLGTSLLSWGVASVAGTLPNIRGKAFSFPVTAYDIALGTKLTNNPIVQADINISKDGAAFAAIATAPSIGGVSNMIATIALTATEMTADTILVRIQDATVPAVYATIYVTIDTTRGD